METRAVAAPVLVDLVEDDAVGAARPHRLADRDVGDGLDILARREVADAQREAFGAAVIDEDRGELAVRADVHRAQAEIILPLGLQRLVEDNLVLATGELLAVPGAVLRARLERPPVEPV